MLSKLIKLIDQLAAPALITLLGGTIQFHTAVSIHSILIIRPGGIGDAVLLLPMLQRLSAIYPDATIDVLAERRNAEVFSWSPVVSAVWCYDRPLEFFGLIRRRRYDLVIDTEQWYRLSAVVARLLSCSRSIGFGTNERRRMFTDVCTYFQDMYEAEMFLKLLEPLGADLGNGQDKLLLSHTLQVQPSAIDTQKPFIVMSIGASVAEKKWPAEHFAEVARFCEAEGFQVIVLGGPNDRVVGDCIIKSMKYAQNLAGATSLTEVSVYIAGARLMISCDTGLLHIAQVLGVPTVALFGPTNQKKWNVQRPDAAVASLDAACSPCALFGTIPPCRHAVQCMQIPPAQVIRLVREQLGQL